MKIRVVRSDGNHEVIDLVGKCEVHHGDIMSHVHSESGMDHYFNADGTYDGWGMGASGDIGLRSAGEVIEDVERNRHIEPGQEA